MHFLSRHILRKIEIFLLIGMAFCMPLSRHIMPAIIALLLINKLLIWDFRGWKHLLRNAFLWLFAGFYVLMIIGLIHTDNMQAGLFDLQVKLSLFLFPVLMIFIVPIEWKWYYKILNAFMAGCIAAGFFLSAVAYMQYRHTGEVKWFFYKYLSFVHHPSYLSMFCGFALLIAFRGMIRAAGVYARGVFILSAVLLLVMIMLLSSKAGIITLCFSLLCGTSAFLRLKRNRLIPLIFVAATLTGIFVVYAQSDFVKSRMQEMVKVLKGQNPARNKTGRIPIWAADWETLLKSPWIGQGTGDVRDALMTTFRQNHFTQGVQHKLNAHNQFFQSALAVGITAGAWVFFMLFIPFVYAIWRGRYLYACFLLIITINFAFESMLETQAGVIFYAFFNSLMFFNMQEFASRSLHIKKNLSL